MPRALVIIGSPNPGSFGGHTPPGRERDVFGDPLDDIWRRCVGAYLGGAPVHRIVASPLGGSTDGPSQGWLDAVHEVTQNH